MAIGVLYLDWVVVSAKAFDDFKYQMDLLNGILLQNNQVRNKSEDKCHMILHECRLDPTVGKNLDAWFILRLKLIEDNDTENKIKKSIDLMNISILVVVTFTAWLVYKDLFYTGAKVDAKKLAVSDMLSFSLFLLASIIIPVMGTLNTAVTSQEVMNGGCQEKLTHLQLNIQLLKNQSETPQDFDAMLNDISQINQLNGMYEMQKFKFLWALEITPALRNKVVSAMTGVCTAVI